MLSVKEINSSAELEDIDARLNAIAPHETALAQRKHVLAEEMRRIRYEINGRGILAFNILISFLN